MADNPMFAAPIPGANYTSDPKNYPWHRPPEITNLDDAIELSFKKLTEENASVGILTMLEMGTTVASLTHAFVMSGIGAGKWTPDFAILLAGPVSHIIYLMAKGYGIDCEMGIEDKVHPPSIAFFKSANKKAVTKDKIKKAIAKVDLEMIKQEAADVPTVSGLQNVKSVEAVEVPQRGGFMSMAGGQPDPESLEEEAEIEEGIV